MKGDWQYRSFGNSEVLSAEQLRRLLEYLPRRKSIC